MKGLFAIGALVVLAGCASELALHLGPVTALVVTADDEVFSASQAGVLRGVGDAAQRFCDPPFRALALAVSRDGTRVVVAGGRPGKSGVLAVYSRGGEELATAEIANDLVYSIALCPGDSRVLCALADGRVVVVALPELSTPTELHRHGSAATVVVAGPGLVSGGRDGLLITSTTAATPPAVASDHSAAISSLCLGVGPGGAARLWSGASDGKVRLHDGPRLVRTWQRLGARVEALVSLGEPDICYAGLANGDLLRLGPDASGVVVVARHAERVTALARDRGGLVVASGGVVTRWKVSVAPPRFPT